MHVKVNLTNSSHQSLWPNWLVLLIALTAQVLRQYVLEFQKLTCYLVVIYIFFLKDVTFLFHCLLFCWKYTVGDNKGRGCSFMLLAIGVVWSVNTWQDFCRTSINVDKWRQLFGIECWHWRGWSFGEKSESVDFGQMADSVGFSPPTSSGNSFCFTRQDLAALKIRVDAMIHKRKPLLPGMTSV